MLDADGTSSGAPRMPTGEPIVTPEPFSVASGTSYLLKFLPRISRAEVML